METGPSYAAESRPQDVSLPAGLQRRQATGRCLIALALVSGAPLLTVRLVQAQPASKPVKGPASPEELRVWIGKATRLSVLSDRVTRCQVQRSLGVLASRAERQLEDTQREVRKGLADLSAAGLPDAASRLVAPSKDAYEVFLKKSADLDVSKPDAVAAFASEADAVGDRLDALVEALVRATGRTTAQVLSTTADLQRLTQHAAVHFLLASAGVQPEVQLKEVAQARTEFGAGLKSLATSQVRSEAIDSQLSLLEPQWLLMSTALGHPGRDARTLENICTTSERLLEVTSSLYALYDAALKA